MDQNKKDYIIIKAGYDCAINEILEELKNLPNYDIIKSRILRKQQQHFIGNREYEGFLYKFYEEENQLGYLIFDDIYGIKGVCIFIEEGTYKELEEDELIYAKNNILCIWKEKFSQKDLINLRYEELLNKFKSI